MAFNFRERELYEKALGGLLMEVKFPDETYDVVELVFARPQGGFYTLRIEGGHSGFIHTKTEESTNG